MLRYKIEGSESTDMWMIANRRSLYRKSQVSWPWDKDE